MSGVVATFTPGALPGLDIGAARYFHQAWTGHVGAAELRSPFEGLVKSSLPTGPQASGSGNADALKNQLASVFNKLHVSRRAELVYILGRVPAGDI